MTMFLNRRGLLTGTGAMLLAAGASPLMAASPPPVRDADQDAEAFVQFLAEVHDDYVNGRVVEHEGWVLSQHEFDAIGKRQGKPQKLVTVG